MSLFDKTESYLGVDIGAHGMKLVELRKTKKRPQLWTYGIAKEAVDIHLKEEIRGAEKSPEELLVERGKVFEGERKEEERLLKHKDDPRIDRYADMLKELWVQSKASTKNVTASLPVSYVFHAVITLPEVDEKELEYHVRAKVKKMLPRPVEDMQIVQQIIPDGEDKKKKFLRVLVTAAPKSLITFYTAIFQKAGLVLQELETEAFALERSLVGRDKATSMIVDMGAERTNFFIIDMGLPLVHRSIRAGGHDIDSILMRQLGVDDSAVGQIKKDIAKMSEAECVSFSKIFEPVIDPIIKEVEYSFNMFLKQTGNEGKRPEKIILTGGSSIFPFIAKYIQSKFDMKVFLGDPWARVVYQEGLKPILDKLGPRMAVSIGLALRNLD